PRRVRVYKEKADLLQNLERYEQAVAVLEQLTHLDRENAAEYYLQQGKLLERLQYNDRALEAYNNAIKVDSNGAWLETTYQRKGDLLLNLKRYEEAVDAYKQAVLCNAKVAVYHENMGNALLELERYEEALVAYETCLHLRKGEDPPTIFDKGRALSGLERYEEALEAYNEAIRLSAGHPNPRFYHEKGVVLETLAQQAFEQEKQIRTQREPRLIMATPAIHASKLAAYALQGTIEAKDGPVLSSVISPSSRVLAMGGASGVIRLMDMLTGMNLSTLNGHTLYVWCLTFLSNDRLLSGSEDHHIKVWNLPKERILHDLVGHQHAVRCIAGTPDKQTIVSGSNDFTIKFWDLQTGQELLSRRKHTQRVLSIAISPNGSFFASAGWDKEIYVWDLLTRQILHTLTGHTGYIYRVAISPDGKLIASGSADSTVHIWDSNTGKLIHILIGHKGSVHGVDFCPDEPVLVSSGADGAIFFWNPLTGQKLYKLTEESPASDIIWSVNFSPDGQFLVSRHGNINHHGDDVVKIWRKK
ncbi:MAG TPA: tetratricopeptide repeat protein, partial [Ktedonobacteraceae bacterium]|nr:tetratricopeptide repeat protein [Ktedonobacteraceae bacterium]